ncbi:MAG: PepSY domain-containing protein [Eggerthellaceae bacterium]|nr:PepSY domain-containing protein [Eggerthellaceae bacterium]
MKKIVVMATALVLAFALAGCGAQASTSSKSSMSASDASTSSSSSSSATSWTDAKTAEDAAKGAGLATFGAPTSTMIADITFDNPKYGYKTGVAQAVYEKGAAQLNVRKSDASHTSALSDEDTSKYANNWKKTHEGFEVTCYGPARGAAAFVTWADGTNNYGASILGLGGEQLTMDEEDVGDIVKAVTAANASTTSTSSSASSSASASSAASSSYISEQDAINKAVAALALGLPENATAQLVTGGDAPHYEVTLTWGTEKHIVTLDAITGQVWDTGYNQPNGGASASIISEDQAKTAAIDAAAIGIPESVEVQYVDATVPYYIVNMVKNGTSYSITINARTGAMM